MKISDFSAAPGGLRVLALAFALLLAPQAAAHVAGIDQHGHRQDQFYTALSIGAERVDMLLTIPGRTVRAAGADAGAFADEALSAFEILSDDQRCRMELVDVFAYPAVDAFQYEVRATCPAEPARLVLRYHLFRDQPFHVNQVEFWMGPHGTFTQVGGNLRDLTFPVAYMIREQGWVLPDEPAPLAGRPLSLADYFYLGFTHVLGGVDHIAFLIGLLVVVTRLGTLILLITSFTVAHSMTLGASALSLVTIDVGLTETLIALTIVYIGIENLWGLYRTEGEPAFLRRWIVTFIFGLIHGFGFSFVLRETGLPQQELLPALLLFNLGVEAAQVAAVAAPFAAAQVWLRKRPWWPGMAVITSAGVCCAGGWWLVERILS